MFWLLGRGGTVDACWDLTELQACFAQSKIDCDAPDGGGGKHVCVLPMRPKLALFMVAFYGAESFKVIAFFAVPVG